MNFQKVLLFPKLIYIWYIFCIFRAANNLIHRREHMTNLQRQELWLQLLINMSHFVDKRVSKSGEHSENVAKLASTTARQLKMSENEVKVIYWSSILHDIGKIGISDRILRKKTALSADDWAYIKMHPTIGSNIVSSIDMLPSLAPTISAHQEKYDGSGYPKGISGKNIPLGARILGIADAYQAMIEDRYYRDARTHDEAVNELQKVSGTQFDPEVLDVFLGVVNKQTPPATQ
jgi:putative nucleotidyltransferase with HDIG domain